MIRPFTDSTALVRDGAALGANLDRDGYLFLRGVLPRDEIMGIRRQLLALLRMIEQHLKHRGDEVDRGRAMTLVRDNPVVEAGRNERFGLVQTVTKKIVEQLDGTIAVTSDAGKGTTVDAWYQNAAYIYVPFAIVGVVLAWTMLKSVPVTANIKQQMDIFRNPDTWLMTMLYVMTFGTFSGLSAQFGLLIKNLYGAGNAAIVNIASVHSYQNVGGTAPYAASKGGVQSMTHTLAAEYAKSQKHANVGESRMQEDWNKVKALLERPQGADMVGKLRLELGEEMNSHVAVYREDAGLRQAVAKVQELKERQALVQEKIHHRIHLKQCLRRN